MKLIATPLMLAAATTLAAAPAIAAPANPASSLSIARSVRAHAPAGHGSRLQGLSTSTLTFGVVGLILIGAVILIATNDTPDSV